MLASWAQSELASSPLDLSLDIDFGDLRMDSLDSCQGEPMREEDFFDSLMCDVLANSDL